ncbi:rhomboid family intramembrane serine protease, partial [Corynebacterium sp.]|uniref:rhomboid family intramembrane serine protease n=1 Tax=Corynebacterium sp. TaxID=1720 RepID=UPI0026DEFFBD
LWFAAAYVIVIWIVHVVNIFVFAGQLVFFGIHPLDVSSLWHIVTSPLLHANVEHLISNTIPGAVFSFLIGMSRARVWWEVTAIVVVLGGLGVWLFGGVGTNHIGASGLVYGWLGYLLVRGLFNRSVTQLLVGIILGITYSGLIWGVLPGVPGVSWQAHLFGAVGGVAAGMFITSDDPPQLRARRAARKLDGGSVTR